jgi:hypothetical protein
MQNEHFDGSSYPSREAPTHAQIASLAHELWIEQGCPHGRDKETWYEAERMLTSPDPIATSGWEPQQNTPLKEEVPGRKSLVRDDDAIAENFESESPLVAKVERQILDREGDAGPRSITSADR